jgi:hypothetical protein
VAKRLALTILLALSCAAAALLGFGVQTGERPAPPAIKQLDRVLISSDSPRELYDIFTGILELPVAWPLTSLSDNLSAGVGFGNIMLEIFGPQEAARPPQSPRARFSGLALEPVPLSAGLSELKSRNIAYELPASGQAGDQSAASTTVRLPQFSNPDLLVFLSEYNPAYLNIYIRRNQLAGQLTLSKGGALGVKSVREVVIGSPHSEGESILWKKLLRPAQPKSAGFWKLGAGPDLRIIQGETSDRIVRIILSVESLPKAKEFLAGKKLLGVSAPGSLTILPSKIQGLKIQLAEQQR